MSETTDMVVAVTLPDLKEGLAVATRLGRYLPEWISEKHPDITSLMFSLQLILSSPLEDPVDVVYDISTHYFLAESDIAKPTPEELDFMLCSSVCPFCGTDNRESGCDKSDCPGVLLKDGKRYFNVLTVRPGGQLVFHGIQLGT